MPVITTGLICVADLATLTPNGMALRRFGSRLASHRSYMIQHGVQVWRRPFTIHVARIIDIMLHLLRAFLAYIPSIWLWAHGTDLGLCFPYRCCVACFGMDYTPEYLGRCVSGGAVFGWESRKSWVHIHSASASALVEATGGTNAHFYSGL